MLENFQSKEAFMEKTKSSEMKLYLASKNLSIHVNRILKVGRSSGDVIIEDDEELSGLHCELTPKIMSLYIKDLGSHNGVYVNHEKIEPLTDYKLEPEDEVVFGNQKFMFIVGEEEYLKHFPKPDRRKNPRPKGLFAPIHLINFHAASVTWKCIYVLGLLITLASLFLNLQLSTPLPEHLQFLTRLYHEQIIVSGLKAFFLVWLMSFLHSFLVAHYLNRNISRQVFAFGLYAVALFFNVNVKNGPMSAIKSYVESRDIIMKENYGEKAILRLKMMVDTDASLKSSYPLVLKQLEGDQKKAIEEDFHKMTKTIERDLAGKP